jgi:hypothetical protein
MNRFFTLTLTIILSLSLLCGCGNQAEESVDFEQIVHGLLEEKAFVDTVTIYDCLSFDSAQREQVDNKDYYKVIDPDFDTWDKWADYLASVYTGQILDDVIQNNKIINIGGDIYTNDGSKGNDRSKQWSVTVLEKTDSNAKIRQVTPNIDNTYDYEQEISLTLTLNGWRIEQVNNIE